MSTIMLVTTILLIAAQLALPKRLAFLPLIVAGCHLGNREILPELTAARLLIVVGLLRAISGGFVVWPNRNKLDVVFVFFSAWALLSFVGHKPDVYMPSPFSARAGMVVNTFGAYLYARAYLPDTAAFKRYALLLPLILIPLAVFMTLENKSGRNLYYVLGARSPTSMEREGRIRAQGPFQHPILAGCAGATALAYACLNWRLGQSKLAILGFAACMGVVLSSSSSGPLAALAVTITAMIFWRWRSYLKHVLWMIMAAALLFNIIKGRGPWYLMASIDLVGGSTGWHRAKLIDQGFKHLDEWWFMGTDYTRHWMATGVRWNPNMIDLTNYYLHLGVMGGLPLTLGLIGFIVIGFKLLVQRMIELRAINSKEEFTIWCAGTALATHAVSFISISYFDQMYIFFYVLLGAIPGLVGISTSEESPAPVPLPVSNAESAKPLRYYS